MDDYQSEEDRQIMDDEELRDQRKPNKYRSSTEKGIFCEPPEDYEGVIPIWNHRSFYKGWIKNGKDSRVFDNIVIEKCMSPARINMRDGSWGEDFSTVEITIQELLFLESEGIEFLECGIYKQLKSDGNY